MYDTPQKFLFEKNPYIPAFLKTRPKILEIFIFIKAK